MAYDLRNHLAEFVEPGPRSSLADRVTAIVTTSPTHMAPSVEHIVETIDSIRAQADLGDCEVIVICDGVRPEQADLTDAYDEYVRRLVWACGHRWANVVPIVMDEWVHHGQTFKRALEEVDTGLVLGMDHDTPLVTHQPIEWEGIAQFCESGNANSVRLLHDYRIPPEHEYLMLDEKPRAFGGVRLVRTVQVSQRPHVARTDWYREILDRYIGRDSRCHVEDVLYGPVVGGFERLGPETWDAWKLWLYVPAGPDASRSYHLDSRGGGPNFEPVYAYDGEIPDDAPRSVPEGGWPSPPDEGDDP